MTGDHNAQGAASGCRSDADHTSFAAAAVIAVKMLNKGSDGGKMVFEPTLMKLEPGDTIKFVAADK
ncbi:cupredoxin domain-containing protein [Bradyrhizobium monzae]|uniref:hypothetical protein n=1 Tax=Bradyrhizobium sp. Oc8 TaxID=2876780 RepID=UPI001F2A5F00|nr:hypothetical protein [Bradyrhizobium sp. Oc8]